MTATAFPGFEKRLPPLRPLRLGTQRRRAKRADSPALGVSRSNGVRANSLDTKKQLETTDYFSAATAKKARLGGVQKLRSQTAGEWLRDSRTAQDIHDEHWQQHRVLTATVHKIWQRAERLAHDEAAGLVSPLKQDDEALSWWREYRAVAEVRDGEAAGDAFLRAQRWLQGYKDAATGKKIPGHKPKGFFNDAWRWARTWANLSNCQTEWIGYTAACCEEHTGAVAVPIGCNNRLCAVCAWRRSQKARSRIKRMYDRLNHPVMLTLTVPNKTGIRKHDFKLFRQKVRQFLKQHPDFLGGVYSIETTWNSEQQQWHIHAHVLADLARPLPTKKENKIELFGERVRPFDALKLGWEFDWLCLWMGGKVALFPGDSTKMPSKMAVARVGEQWMFDRPTPKKNARKRLAAWLQKWEDYEYTFKRWVQRTRAHSNLWAKRWNGFHYVLRDNLSADELRLVRSNEAWNRRWRRIIDIRPVKDRDGAAAEVLKYITKGADFIHDEKAVEEFLIATRGARLVQTFGTWYGFDLEASGDKDSTRFEPADFEKDWSEFPPCACGRNAWERCGVFSARDVRMRQDGRYLLRRSFTGVARGSPGTVVKPLIRALVTDHNHNPKNAAAEGMAYVYQCSNAEAQESERFREARGTGTDQF